MDIARSIFLKVKVKNYNNIADVILIIWAFINNVNILTLTTYLLKDRF